MRHMRRSVRKFWENDPADMSYVIGQLNKAEASVREALDTWNDAIDNLESADGDAAEVLKEVANGVSEYLMDAVKLRRDLKGGGL